LADGSAIRLTTAYWQRSSGAPIENLGVVPDIAIDIQNQKMITELEQDDAVRLACQILDKSVSSKIDDLKAAAQGLIQGSN
jgi:C-terminal processing protease CtpA/Prc